MVRFLFKTILISIISGSLSTANVSVLAADASSDTTATAQMSKATYSRDSNGVLTKTESHQFEGTDKGDSAIQTITMIAIGFVGVRLMRFKKWTPDMMVVAAASAAYLAANIANILSLKKQIKDMEAKVTKRADGKVDQTQIEILQKLKESYEAAKKSLQTTKNLQLGAAAIFAAATATAAYQRLTEEGQKKNCEFSIVNAQTELAACAVSATIAASEASSCAVCNAQLTDFGAGIATTGDTLPPLPTTSYQKAMADMPKDARLSQQAGLVCGGAIASGIKSKSVPHACATYLTTKNADKAYTDVLISNFTNSKKMLLSGIPDLTNQIASKKVNYSKIRTQLQKALDIFFPRAEAGWLPLLGLGAGAATALLAAESAMMKTVDQVIYTPGGRIIAWGLMTGAALMAASSTQGEIDKTEQNIEKIDRILKDLNTLQKGIKGSNVSEQQIKIVDPNRNFSENLQLSINPNLKTDCMVGTSNNNCNPIVDQVRNMPGFSELPDSLKALASQSGKLGEGLSGANSISAATLMSVGQMAGKQSAISSLAKSIKKKLNEEIAKSGKPIIDFNKHEKNLWNQMKSNTGIALKKSGMTGGAFLSSTGIAPISSALTASNTPLKMSPPRGAPNSSQSEKNKNKEGEFMLDLSDNSSDLTTGTGGLEAAGSFDIGSNDINTNSEASIFQVISNRYIRSAYPKLLEEIPIKN